MGVRTLPPPPEPKHEHKYAEVRAELYVCPCGVRVAASR